MEKKLKKRDAELKLKVAIEAVKGALSISQIASQFWIHYTVPCLSLRLRASASLR